MENKNLKEMIEMAIDSEHGIVWYSDRGPIQITKEGKLEPLFNYIGPKDPILSPEWKVNLKEG